MQGILGEPWKQGFVSEPVLLCAHPALGAGALRELLAVSADLNPWRVGERGSGTRLLRNLEWRL